MLILFLQKVQKLGQREVTEKISYDHLLSCCPAMWITSWLGRNLIFFLFHIALIRSLTFNL